MKINPATMMFEDLTPEERRELRSWAEAVVLRGDLPQPTPAWVLEWLKVCNYSSDQALFLLPTVLPLRVLFSLLPPKTSLDPHHAEINALQVDALQVIVRQHARRLRITAEKGGRPDDGGASELLTLLDAWSAGLRGQLLPQFLAILEGSAPVPQPTEDPPSAGV